MATNVVRHCQQDDLMKQRVLIVEDEFLIALDLGATVEGIGMQVAGLANDRE
ncbi:response regulator, partial [Mesorhizobium sp. M1A.T.Ca.IN.004.03.1.1]